jgi:hypothetical protein
VHAGGRDNARMLKKGLFHALSMPAKDGNYFLRPDRIVGAFFLPSSEPPVGRFEAKAALASEREEDAAAKERIDSVQRDMTRWAQQLQDTNKELRHHNRSEGTAVGLQQNSAVYCDPEGFDTTNLGDIELNHFDPSIRQRKKPEIGGIVGFEDRFQGAFSGTLSSENDDELAGSGSRVGSAHGGEGIVLGPESVRLTMVVNSPKEQQRFGSEGGAEDGALTGSYGMHPLMFDADDESDIRVSVTHSFVAQSQDPPPPAGRGRLAERLATTASEQPSFMSHAYL